MPAPTAGTVQPARRIRGQLRVPGDKSISHRYAILSALAAGRSELVGFAPGADCRSTLACLRGLGVDITEDTDAIHILGRGLGQLRSPRAALDAGNSGTTMRLLAGVAAGHPFSTTFVGDSSLSRRPMRRVLAPLARMGATTESVDGHAPLTIHGTRLHGIAHATEVPSAQIKSAVLLAGLHADGITTVSEAAPTRDHTERAFRTFGAAVEGSNGRIAVSGGQRLGGRRLRIPGDFSSAAFWMVAAAVLPGSRVQLDEIGLNPTRTALVGVLRRFGATVTVEAAAGAVSSAAAAPGAAAEPCGTICVECGDVHPIVIEPAEVPGLIDELPAIATLAAGGGDVDVHGAAELRVKESDRIAALVAGLRHLGFQAEERPDGFTVAGVPPGALPGGAVVDALGDHRIAMALAIAALTGRRPSIIEGANHVAISYPGFFEVLAGLVE
jgi:3-phosphoshikimate 1-carboxyvinyltransferase